MKTGTHSQFFGISVLAVVLGVSILATSASRGEEPSLAQKISKQWIFEKSLTWVGDKEPPITETEAIWGVVSVMGKEPADKSISRLEAFAQSHPDSQWTPSIHANIGKYYREQGFYTRAMKHWETAWNLTKTGNSEAAKSISDYSFANWTSLLASLGRIETLKEMYKTLDGRKIEPGTTLQKINTTAEGLRMMINNPGRGFRCGTFALHNVGKAIKGPKYSLNEIDSTPSPVVGFSMTQLTEMADRAQLDLIAVERGPHASVVVPSIVHWRQEHYAAIMDAKAKDGSLWYLVLDPTFGRGQWIREEAINEEASGNFLIPRQKLTSDWARLDRSTTDLIFGRGGPNDMDDGDDGCGNGSGGSGSGGGGSGSGGSGGGGAASSSKIGGGCGRTCSGGGNGNGNGNGGTGGNGTSCDTNCTAPALAVWEVSEPYITTWLYDEPIAYNPGVGNRISFKLAYKQRDTRTQSTNLFGVGKQWNCSWINYIVDDGFGNFATMSVPGGGERTYAPWSSTGEYYSNTRITRTPPPNGCAGSSITSFQIDHPNGARDYYNYVATNLLGTYQVAYITEEVDPYGHTNRFEYSYDSTNMLTRLVRVIDADGKTNTLSYTNLSYPSLITGVTDPFGRTTTLRYNSSGVLTNIVDPIGINSSFVYDDRLWVTNLVTPYGTTRFEYTSNSWQGVMLGGTNVNRAVKVTDAEGGTYLWMYRDRSDVLSESDATPLLPGNYTDDFPGGIGEVLPAPLYNSFMHYRNSFHWGPRQYANLSTTNMYNFSVADYRKARRKNWLHSAVGGVGQTLNMVCEPSPDPNGSYDGQKTWFDYDSRNGATEGTQSQPILIARLLPNGTNWWQSIQRNGWGKPLSIVETYSISSSERGARTNTFVYDDAEIDLLHHIGPHGQTEAGYRYDANHNILEMTNAVNEVTQYTYNANGLLTSIHTAAGLTTTNIYYASGDSKNFLQKSLAIEISATNSYTYTNNLVLLHTDPLGLVVSNSYDALRRLVVSAYPDGTTISNQYSRLDLTESTDRMGYLTKYGFDNVRRMTSVTNALGAVTRFNYCSCGALESTEDALHNVTYFYYDQVGRLTNTIYPDGYMMTNWFDSIGQLLGTKDSAGSWITNAYNIQGLVVTSSNAFGQLNKVIYDVDDRATNTVDANGVSIAQTLDDLGRVMARSYPDGGIERFAYSARGMTAYTNQLGKVTRYGYDEAGRKCYETNANLEVTAFQYDAAGNLTRLIDGKSQSTYWIYDEYGRVTNKLDNSSALMFYYVYDANNRLSSRWTPGKGTTLYAYDKIGNLTNVNYQTSPDLSFAYDAMNRLTNMTDAVGATKYTYTAVGLLQTEDGPWASDTVSYSYANRKRSSLTLAQPNVSAWIQTYGYDLANRLTSITSPAGEFDYEYAGAEPSLVTPATLVKRLALPNGAAITNAYDSVARMTKTYLINSTNGVLDKYDYSYNLGNQRTNVTRTSGDYVSYAYDSIGQLTNASGREANSTLRLQEQFGYGYDAAGNLNTRTNNGLVQTFGVNALNELTTGSRSGTLTVAGATTATATNVSVTDGTMTQGTYLYGDAAFATTNGFTLVNGNNTFTATAQDSYSRTDSSSVTVNLPASPIYQYDANGNLTNDSNRVFEYDDENQLIAVWKTNAWRSEFSYDGKMRRKARKEFSWQGGSWVETNEVHYVYDGNLVIQERNANNIGAVTYTRGNDLSGSWEGVGGVGGLLARTDHHSLQSAYYHSDGNGNITAMIDDAENIVARYLYDPFGKVLSQCGILADVNCYRFSSMETDRNNGLICFLYRLYDPNHQRWINRDPINEEGGVNLFTFVMQNPINFLDRYGLSGEADAIARPILRPGSISIPLAPGPWLLLGAGSINADLKSKAQTVADTLLRLCKRKTRCEKVYDNCIHKVCIKTLPTKDYGATFRNCVRKCMEAEGCSY